MGRLIGLLVLLNGVVLVAGLSLEQVRRQPAMLLDFNADKVRLLGRVEPAPVAPARLASASSAGVAAAPATAPRLRCLAWRALDEGLLGAIESRLQAAGIAASSYDIHLEEHLGWWVYLPPFADAAATQAAIDAAIQKGVKDIAPVRGGEMENAVSLGAFPTLSRARAQMERLGKLGLQGLQMGPRPNSGTARLTLADDVPEAKLSGLGENWDKGHAPLTCAGE